MNTDGKKTVLLVEDSELVREMTKLALEMAGFQVYTAVGNTDLEDQIAKQPGFLDDLDLMVLDMELEEDLDRQREDKGGVHVGSQMTGSQIGLSLSMVHPQLKTVPFLIYSGKEQDEIQAHLDELTDFAAFDEQLSQNYKGFVQKQAGAEMTLVHKVMEILSD